MSLLSLIGLGIVLFATTNVDDVFVLLGFFSDPKFETRQIAIGQYAGIGALFAVSVIASLVSLVLDPAYIGLLGFAPIAIGLVKLSHLWRGPVADSADTLPHGHDTRGHSNMFAVAAVTIANGGDNISIYTPLFATGSGYEVAVVGAVFAVMTGAWLIGAHWLTSHRTLGAPIRRYGHRVVPIVLIALGLYILQEAGTLALF